MCAVFIKVHNDAKAWLRRNAFVILVMLSVYAAMVAGNHVQHGGELVIGAIAGVTSAAAVFAIGFFIAGPIALVLMTAFTYLIEGPPRT